MWNKKFTKSLIPPSQPICVHAVLNNKKILYSSEKNEEMCANNFKGSEDRVDEQKSDNKAISAQIGGK